MHGLQSSKQTQAGLTDPIRNWPANPAVEFGLQALGKVWLARAKEHRP